MKQPSGAERPWAPDRPRGLTPQGPGPSVIACLGITADAGPSLSFGTLRPPKGRGAQRFRGASGRSAGPSREQHHAPTP